MPVAATSLAPLTRQLTILPLGLVREPALQQHFKRWLADAALAVRTSATVLLASKEKSPRRAGLECQSTVF